MCNDRTRACIVLYAPFPLIWYAQCNFQKKFFRPFNQIWGWRVCVRTGYGLHGAWCSIPFNLICKMTTFSNEMLWPFDPTIGAEGTCKDRLCVCMVPYAPFPLIWYATRLLSEKNVLTFDPTTGVEGVCKDKICGCMLLHSSFPLIWYAAWLCSEKVNFDPWAGGGGVYGQNICYHVAACVIPFSLICNMTILWESLILASVPPPKSTQGQDPSLQTKIPFDMFHIKCTSVCMQNFSEKLTATSV